jgi:hypothetical protein
LDVDFVLGPQVTKIIRADPGFDRAGHFDDGATGSVAGSTPTLANSAHP